MPEDKPPLISQPVVWVVGVLLAIFSSALFLLRSETMELLRDVHEIDTRQQLHEQRHEFEESD